LLGIDSVMAPLARRQEAWARIASDLPLASLEAMATTVPLAQAVDVGGQILQGAVRGRVIVDTNAVS
jgi:acrylyl-CoA reductase (NADPH)